MLCAALALPIGMLFFRGRKDAEIWLVMSMDCGSGLQKHKDVLFFWSIWAVGEALYQRWL